MTLIEEWRKISQALSLDIIEQYILQFDSGSSIKSEFLLKNFGDEHGMLIIKDFQQIEDNEIEFDVAGYGCCVMNDIASAITSEIDPYDYIEVLRDWGWTGPESERPDWL